MPEQGRALSYRRRHLGPAGLRLEYGWMKVAEQLRERREEILRVATKHGAGNVLVFGSVARGEETTGSDVDLLVDITGEPGPWFPGGLVADLEKLLGRPVQVVIRRSLSPLIRDSVLKDASPL